ncbi:hypothetical protein [Vibrio sp. 10N.261.46.A3]|uniref:hypothetical protein n=1 Tax=Vibrio sp. 10N.261.46.A3 TaxID=3229658 RepID=UPI0035526D79
MTSKTIKKDIAHATELAKQLRQAMFDINAHLCDEMKVKNQRGESATEETLMHEMVLQKSGLATDLYGHMVMLDNIYNEDA